MWGVEDKTCRSTLHPRSEWGKRESSKRRVNWYFNPISKLSDAVNSRYYPLSVVTICHWTPRYPEQNSRLSSSLSEETSSVGQRCVLLEPGRHKPPALTRFGFQKKKFRMCSCVERAQVRASAPQKRQSAAWDWWCRFRLSAHSFLQPLVKYTPNVMMCLTLLQLCEIGEKTCLATAAMNSVHTIIAGSPWVQDS